ncbi:MAG: anthranilate synthase component I [Verrucomicrobiota bacterium]
MEASVLRPEIDEFRRLAATGNLIPVYTELAADYETPISAFEKIKDGTDCFLFESAEKSDQVGRYSFLGSRPRLVFRCCGQQVEIIEDRRERRVLEVDGDPLRELERVMSRFDPVVANDLPVFHGGAVGYIGYDSVRYFEPTVGEGPPDELGVPDILFLVTDTLIVFDHRFRRMQVVANVYTEEHESLEAAYESGREKIAGLIRKLEKPLQFKPLELTGGEPANLEPSSNTSQTEYEDMVTRGKEYIHAGDIFQFVPSQRFEVGYEGTAIDFYRALRHVNPSPYMFCLEFGEDGFSVVGSSPEVHVRCLQGKVEIRPIAGTRWRGKTVAEDDALAEDLLSDPKELAEHIMLVDLARNDVGRIAKFDSVTVTDFKIIEKYSHVMHIVSDVVGRLKDGMSAYDVMRATFPAGTVSGSPKIRAMQIINEFEKHKRGVYAGAVGYFGFDGNLDSCIALRTAVLKGGKVYVQAGAGVVADSIPEREYEETVNKAKALIRAVARARELGKGSS